MYLTVFRNIDLSVYLKVNYSDINYDRFYENRCFFTIGIS